MAALCVLFLENTRSYFEKSTIQSESSESQAAWDSRMRRTLIRGKTCGLLEFSWGGFLAVKESQCLKRRKQYETKS